MQLMYRFKELMHSTNISYQSILFRKILKISLVSVVNPGIPGKSQKSKVGMFPKSKEDCTPWISRLCTNLNCNKHKHGQNRIRDAQGLPTLNLHSRVRRRITNKKTDYRLSVMQSSAFWKHAFWGISFKLFIAFPLFYNSVKYR